MKFKAEHKSLIVHKEEHPIYQIHFENSFHKLTEYLNEMDIGSRKICIVTDSTVGGIYAEAVEEAVCPACAKVSRYTFPAGEANKTLNTVRDLYEHLIKEHFDRKDLLVALGGGVVGDLTGFAAATYLRGIDFIQIPTTLLAQVDSSIGGKTGVDFDSYKNMVGAFHQPRMVYMNMEALKTLPDEQFYCGMGEILKHGLIKDAAYYEWVIEHMSEIAQRDNCILKDMVEISCQIKRQVVEADPFERGERALLNFGHTIGHAIEKLKDFQLPHGQCVGLGYVAASYISWKRGLLTNEEFFEIRDMNVGFELPISFAGLSSEEIVKATKHDKKMDSGQIKFVLLKGIGHAYIDKTVTDQELLEAIDYLNAEVGDKNE